MSDDDFKTTGLGKHPLSAIGNVTITNPQDGEVLTYDADSGKWVNLSSEAGAGYQPLDGELTALASVTSAADALPYFTGSETATTTTLTAAGRALLDDADASAQRTTLGLTIGTNVQAYDATLTALASYNTNGILTQTAADTFAGRTLTGTANQITISNGDGVSGNPTFSIPYNLELGSSASGQSSVKFFEDSDNGSNYVILQPATSLASNYTVTLPSVSGTLLSGTNNLSDIDTPATARSNLGLTIGSDVQAYDAELAALAGLTSAADKVPYFTGSGTAAVTDFTSFGRSLVDDANAAAGRSTLGAAASGANTDIDSVTLDNTGLAVADTDASHNLIFKPGSNLSAQRTITITTGDADRTLDISAASVTVSTFGASLVDDSDAATARTTMGVKIGTDVQAYDATLAALASYNTNGLITQTSADTFTGRTITGTANQITVSNGDGVSGNPTLSIPYNLVLGSSSSGPSSITFNEDTDNGSNTITIQAPSSISSSVTLTLPGDDGDSGYVLSTDGSGTLSWVAQSGGGGLTEWTAASASGPASLYFSEDTDNGSNKITVTAPSSLGADYTVTLPSETGTILTTASGQPLDATLTALAAYNTNGLITQTSADTFTGRTITGTANQISVSNGDGVSGNPTLSTPQDIATSSSPQFAGLELGHASDTTLTRVSAGNIAVEGNTIYRAGGTDVPLADGGTGASLVDPGADRIMFWDDSAGAVTWLTAGTGLTITDTTIEASGGGGGALSLYSVVPTAWYPSGSVTGFFPGSASTTISLPTGTIYYFPFFVPTSTTYTDIGSYITSTSSGNINLCIYADNGAGKPTGSPITNSTSGSIASGANSFKSYTFSSAITLAAGRHWLAIATSATNSTHGPKSGGYELGGIGLGIDGTPTSLAGGTVISGWKESFTYSTTMPTVGGSLTAIKIYDTDSAFLWLKTQ